MSDFMDMMVEMLPVNSQLQKKDNPIRVVLDRTVGAYMDTFEIPYEQIFLTSASGGWLDAHGRDYSVPRRLDEDDDTYRQRIIYEKLDHLTPALLSDVYGIRLFTYREDFDVKSNTLVSDNPHIVMNDSFLGLSDEDTIQILDKKFILDNVVTWINSDGDIEYILDTRGVNILPNYSKIYELTNLFNYFMENTGIKQVKLNLPNATLCRNLFYKCSNLIDVDLQLPNVSDCRYMFDTCSSLNEIDLTLPNATNCSSMFIYCLNLVNVKLNLPRLSVYASMLSHAPNIETIDVTIPVSKVSGFKSYVTGLNLENLTSFIINGEEQL